MRLGRRIAVAAFASILAAVAWLSFSRAVPRASAQSAPAAATPADRAAWVSTICVNVRQAPGTAAPIIGHLFQGDSVEVVEHRALGKTRWTRVRDAAGYFEGWVSGRLLSNQKVASTFVIPASYNEPRTPSVDTRVTAKFVGEAACVKCHQQEHSKWLGHYHSDAYETLGKPYALAFAKKRGIEDAIRDARCVKCHVTAYGVPDAQKAAGYADAEGVTCEACHGPGGDYLEIHTKPDTKPAVLAASGFTVFRDLKQRDQLCRSCHNELSPTYKPFNIEAFSEAIRHWPKAIEATYAVQLGNQAARAETKAAGAGAAPVETPPVTPPVKAPPVTTPVTTPPVTTPPVVTPPVTTPPVATPPVAPPPITTPPVTPPVTTPSASTPSPAPAHGGGSTTTTPATPANPIPPLESAHGNAAAGADDESGPKEIVLDTREGATKGAVRFSHAKHSNYIDKKDAASVCIVCHHKNQPDDVMDLCGKCHKAEATGAAPDRQAAFHGSCRKCHKAEGEGPVKCMDCHGS